MKTIGFIILAAFFMLSSCDSALAQGNNIPVSNIRSAVYCPVSNCIIEQVHQHNGIYYGGHFNNDGHGHHGLHASNFCTLSHCTEISLHQHNGIYYAGHHGSDGCISHGRGNNHGHNNNGHGHRR